MPTLSGICGSQMQSAEGVPILTRALAGWVRTATSAAVTNALRERRVLRRLAAALDGAHAPTPPVVRASIATHGLIGTIPADDHGARRDTTERGTQRVAPRASIGRQIWRVAWAALSVKVQVYIVSYPHGRRSIGSTLQCTSEDMEQRTISSACGWIRRRYATSYSCNWEYV